MYAVLGTVWLFFMIFTSGDFTSLKIGLLIVLSAISFIESFFSQKKINFIMLFFIITYICYFFLNLVLGIALGYKFDIAEDLGLVNNYIFAPIVIILLGFIFKKRKFFLNFLFSLLLVLTVLLVVFDLGKILTVTKIIPDSSLFDIVEISNNQLADDILSLRVRNEHSFMFLLPMFCSYFFLTDNKKLRIACFFILVGGCLYSVLSARKILEIVVFASIVIAFISYFIKLNSTKKLKILIRSSLILLFFLVIGSYVGAMLGYDYFFSTAWNTLYNGLLYGKGTFSRLDNAEALLNLWSASPLIGNGLNAYASESLANGRTLWSYEINYNALLAQSGIVGILIWFTPVLYISYKLYNNYCFGDKRCLAVLYGFISFIICGASNPLVYIPWPWAVALAFSLKRYGYD